MQQAGAQTAYQHHRQAEGPLELQWLQLSGLLQLRQALHLFCGPCPVTALLHLQNTDCISFITYHKQDVELLWLAHLIAGW